MSAPNSQNAQLGTYDEEAQIRSIISVVNYDVREEAEHDLRNMLKMARQSGPSGAWRCPTCSATCIPHQAKPEAGADDARDAARYRWWTQNFGAEYDGPESMKLYTLINSRFRRGLSEKVGFDAAIDGAMAASKSNATSCLGAPHK